MSNMLRQIGAALSSELDGDDGSNDQQQQTPIDHQQVTTIQHQPEDIDLIEINPLDLFCSSIDTLCGKKIDLVIPPNSGWAERPSCSRYERKPVAGGGGGGGAANTTNSHINNVDNNNNYREEMRELCRHGIPPSLRCAAWIINVVSAANPQMDKSDCDDFGTLKKVRILEHGWDIVLKSIFPDTSDLESAEVLDFGLGHDHLINILMKLFMLTV